MSYDAVQSHDAHGLYRAVQSDDAHVQPPASYAQVTMGNSSDSEADG